MYNNRDTCFKSFEYEGVRIELHWDNDAECPREWGWNIGHIVSFGREYFGDEEQHRITAPEYLENLAVEVDATVADKLEYWRNGKGYRRIENASRANGEHWSNVRNLYVQIEEQCQRIIEKALSQYVILGIGAYNSGNLWTDNSYYQEFDALIIANPGTIRSEYSCKHITTSIRAKVQAALEMEVSMLGKWRAGEFVGFVILEIQEDDQEDCSGSGEVLESCWGFDDEAYCEEEARNMAVGLLERLTRERAVTAWNASPMARELNHYI